MSILGEKRAASEQRIIVDAGLQWLPIRNSFPPCNKANVVKVVVESTVSRLLIELADNLLACW